jgi:hypothetical protein
MKNKKGMRINNDAGIPERDELCIDVICNAEADTPDNGVATLKFSGYSGDAVSLKDYGFNAPVVYNIETMKISNKIPIMYDHYEVIGHTTSVKKVDNASVAGAGLASVPGEATDKVVQGMKNGFPWQASMGLKLNSYEKDISYHANGEVKVNNRTFKAPIFVVDNSRLIEMTVTGFGRDSNTSFFNKDKLMKIMNSATAQTQTPPADAPVTEPETKVENKAPVDPPKEPTKEETAPEKKVDNGNLDVIRVMKLAAKFHDHMDIVEEGLKNGWDDERISDKVELTIINKNTPKPPSPKTLHQNGSLMEARMCLSFGSQPEYLEKVYGEELTNRANDMPQLGILETVLMVANASGGNFTGHSDVEQMCNYVKNSGYSTFDLPDFFRKVGEVMKDERWEINPPFATQVCKEESNKDFRIHERKRMTGGAPWTEVADDGKLELYTAGNQTKYQTSLRTYGNVFTMTREEVINDDMGALTDMMDMMLEGAIMIPDLQLGRLMLTQDPAAGTFWVDDDNSFDGTALTRTNLSARFNAIRQYNENKTTIDWNVMINDRWSLIVSPNLEEAAWDLLKQDRIVSNTTANTIQGEKNYWFGRMDLKTFNQMANTSAFGTGKFVGNTTWILWPSNKKFAPYVITYLRGRKRPTIENAPMPSTFLGFGTRGFWDVKVQERERLATSRQTATA